ncbi:MAG: transposase, partial [Clostridia bacterium]|nr:transposase [Clostridia bacterium]
PSSQTCSACGHVNRDVRDLKIRQWKCPKCGAWHDRDVNAAKNILREGLSMIA